MTDDESPRGLHPTAYEADEHVTYVPYVQQDSLAEFTFRSVLAGAGLGIVFGAANAYLGLMAGLTISTSIPVAVLTVVLFRSLSALGSRHTILETNMSQTIGSASSSVASGVLFTIPALFLWGLRPSLAQLTFLAMSGGLFGVLAMIPLRRYLICREHGKLPYPEGLACAEVLVASEVGGRQASGVFWGLSAGALFKLLTDGLLWIGKTFSVSAGNFVLAAKVSPALIGVGYILGPRVATVMVTGGALSSFVMIPFIAWLGADWSEPFYPGEKPIALMSPEDIWSSYVRYIGAGAVAAAGILTLLRSLPVMYESFVLGVSQLRDKSPAGHQLRRVDDDLPFKYVAIGLVGVLLLLIFVPGILGYIDSLAVKAAAALLIAVFAFFFVTVASRIVGMVGVTSNPTSGMTIAALLGTSLIFYLLGWTDLAGKATALMVGTAVCIAASIAGDTSQDLKTGFLLGATPRRQQIGEILGVVTSAWFVCLTIVVLDKSIGIGSPELPAPQATLMRLVIDGVIDQDLPWRLVFIGAALAVVPAVVGLPSLAFAVGVYLPLSTMVPVFLGGLLRWWICRQTDPATATARRKQGVLFSSGLVGGEGLMGVGLATERSRGCLWVCRPGVKR
jgi:putative OPT family oligopeptide transporter